MNEAITYSDKEGNSVVFPSPEIDVECGIDVIPEPCPEPIDVTIDGCEDSLEVDAGDLALASLGRILQVDVRLRDVCRRVALAVIVTEVDSRGIEYPRGMKTITVPEHSGESCRDVTVRCVRFVLPEDLDVSGSTSSICNERKFKIRLISHYIDNDFSCCDLIL